MLLYYTIFFYFHIAQESRYCLSTLYPIYILPSVSIVVTKLLLGGPPSQWCHSGLTNDLPLISIFLPGVSDTLPYLPLSEAASLTFNILDYLDSHAICQSIHLSTRLLYPSLPALET